MVIEINQIMDERFLQGFVKKIVPVFEQLSVQRIEQLLVHTFGIADRPQLFVDLACKFFELSEQRFLHRHNFFTQADFLGSVHVVDDHRRYRQRLFGLSAELLHRDREFFFGLNRLAHAFFSAPKNFRIASTKPVMSWRRASISTVKPLSRAVLDVIGPMLAIRIPFGHDKPSARKFSTVEELVKVIKSAPSSTRRRRAPVTSRVSGTVRYPIASSTIAPSFDRSFGSTSRAFSARARRIRRFSTPPCF